MRDKDDDIFFSWVILTFFIHFSYIRIIRILRNNFLYEKSDLLKYYGLTFISNVNFWDSH